MTRPELDGCAPVRNRSQVGGKGRKKWRKAPTDSNRVDKYSIGKEDEAKERAWFEAALASGLWSGRSCEDG